eukprot:CAMPEP_0119420740 /NCGR_PEP_ID=MMETSP1335-20130426/24213_1 /TAXON_ID=259385 /ORGANISM="Chrysoculter rhomboideus, Strain RCC1486" /LENGTH=153 /DNA_ID=CAMNT_0007446117 /DNA_START=174 /DNA_END=632 /DNA_ORIENTATION=+
MAPAKWPCVSVSVALVLAKAGCLDCKGEGRKARASYCARLRPAARSQSATSDAATDHRIPHVVGSARLGDVALGQREESTDDTKVLAPGAAALRDVPACQPQLHSQRQVGVCWICCLESVQHRPRDHTKGATDDERTHPYDHARLAPDVGRRH